MHRKGYLTAEPHGRSGICYSRRKGPSNDAYATFPIADIYMVCKEALMIATILDGMTVMVRSGKIATRYENYMGKVTGFRSILITWGEAGLVKTRKKSTPKIGDRGVTCIFVGYNTDSGYDIYKMWNPRKRIHRTR